MKQHGAVDILVNNAAISISGDFLEMSEADYDKVLDINLKGSFLMLQACAREMVKQVAGGKTGGFNHQHVFGQRHARHSENRKLLRRQGRRLTAHPGDLNIAGPARHSRECHRPRIHQDRHAASVVNDKAAMARVLSRTPMGRVGEPSEIASIAVFLASDDFELRHRPNHLRRRWPHAAELHVPVKE